MWEDTLEEDMTTCSSILAWRIPWTEEPVGGGGGRAAVHSIAESLTRLKRLSTHSHTRLEYRDLVLRLIVYCYLLSLRSFLTTLASSHLI